MTCETELDICLTDIWDELQKKVRHISVSHSVPMQIELTFSIKVWNFFTVYLSKLFRIAADNIEIFSIIFVGQPFYYFVHSTVFYT